MNQYRKIEITIYLGDKVSKKKATKITAAAVAKLIDKMNAVEGDEVQVLNKKAAGNVYDCQMRLL